MEAELGVKIHSMNRSIKSGKPMYGNMCLVEYLWNVDLSH